MFTGIWNILDYPAASLPLGRFKLESGIPFPLQIVGTGGVEEVLLLSILLEHLAGHR